MYQNVVSSIALSTVLSTAAMATTSFIDDFSAYGSSLTTGDSVDNSVYTWDVTNRVASSTSVTIDANGAQLAWHSNGHGHVNAAEIDLVFETASRPELEGIDLSFDLVERHDYTDFNINVLGKTDQLFTFASTGTVRFEFTDTQVNQYRNGGLQSSHTYASLGWSSTDQIESFDFVGRHHDNSHNNISSIDNINFSQVPEPSSSMLVMLGAFSFLSRRKR